MPSLGKTIQGTREPVGRSNKTIKDLVDGANSPDYSGGSYKKPKTPRKSGQRIPELDELIGQGATAEKIGRAGGYDPPKQGGYYYIKDTGQIPFWHERRKEVKTQKPKILENLVSILKAKPHQLAEILKARAYQLAKEEGWVYEKALNAFCSPKFNKYSLETFIELFERRQNSEENKSLEQLGEGLMSFGTVGKVFDYVGAEPMYGKRDVHKTPTEKIEAMERGFYLEMSSEDIAYFLGLKSYIVKQKYSKIGKRPVYPPIIRVEPNSSLNYRLSSQIYEAQDLSFSVNEIAYLLDTKEVVVSRAIEIRAPVEKKIINALRVLYADNNINIPYLQQTTKAMR